MTARLADRQGSRGFVFAATGPGYTQLTAQAARSIRDWHDDAQIDLFTDQTDAVPEVFDRVHRLRHNFVHPKYEALYESRFDRTLYLDADTLTIAPVWDVFDVLERFDFAACQDEAPNDASSRRIWRKPLPAAFPQFNCGILATRKSERTDAVLRECDRICLAEQERHDQLVLRELLWDSDLRIAVLPGVYNTMFVAHLEAQDHNQMAPRILHIPKLHNHLHGYGPQIFTPRQAVGPMIWKHIQRMRASDMTLGAPEQRPIRPLMDAGPLGRVRRFIHNSLRDRARRPGRG